MKKAFALLIAAASTFTFAHEQGDAAAIGQLMKSWQARILAQNLPVDDAKNWSRRNMAKFGRLNAERLALAQRATTFEELELVLLEAPLPNGTRLDVLMANTPGDIAVMGAHNMAKSSPATSPASYAGMVFTAVTTCRIMDTRPSQGGFGAWAALTSNTVKIGPYSTGYFLGPGAQGGSNTSCGLDALAGPGQIAAILAAVSTVSQSGSGYLTFYPQGAPNPGTTSVSQYYQPGYVQTSFVLIPTNLVGVVAASGFTSAGTDVIVDVVGYFAVPSSLSLSGNLTLVDPSTSTTGNILKGGTRFIHNAGSANTFAGLSAGNFTLSGTDNLGLGTDALTALTSGGSNVAAGSAALAQLTTGVNNTAIGMYAMTASTTGCCNTAVGDGAFANSSSGSFNVIMGAGAGLGSTLGDFNTIVGTNSFGSTTTASQNTGFGGGVFNAVTSGVGNTALGYVAGSNITTGNSNISIGNSGTSADSGVIRIGDFLQSKAFIAGIRGVTTTNANAVAVFIDSSGQLGTVSSSLRAKDDIADMDAASSALMKLRPVTFHYKSDQAPSGRSLQYGLIAEEVADVYPNLIAHSADGKVETVMYHFLPPMLLNEVQKQQRTIETQAAHIAGLEREVTEMKGQMARLAKAIDR